jgi:hypothetical protein
LLIEIYGYEFEQVDELVAKGIALFSLSIQWSGPQGLLAKSSCSLLRATYFRLSTHAWRVGAILSPLRGLAGSVCRPIAGQGLCRFRARTNF